MGCLVTWSIVPVDRTCRPKLGSVFNQKALFLGHLQQRPTYAKGKKKKKKIIGIGYLEKGCDQLEIHAKLQFNQFYNFYGANWLKRADLN